MRCLIQRVNNAEVKVKDQTVGKINCGLMILVCAMAEDTFENADTLARKIANLRIFKDEQGKMNKSLMDTGGQALVISQFTLAADTSRGNRPGFSTAAPPDKGKELYDYFAEKLRDYNIDIETGVFGADMDVTLTNSGPVTIWLDV